MLFLLREIYDPAVHLTNQEYRQKSNGEAIHVPSAREAPYLYMLGGSGAKDADQLAVVPTCREYLSYSRTSI